MKRKVNLVGINTLTVSLPSKWVKEHNIRKGDELEMRSENDSLIIGGSYKTQKKKRLRSISLVSRTILEGFFQGLTSKDMML
ncbi:MAG: AbrB/MazE/SpoVT family DNA-binding domain-containing protein [Candidatus Woesearchaeota archaeon]|jgi:phosphate uptake regulator|nr:AbrB/MazE/SpoVT family DNA-binding domain-containing protein [Candidatus Woesearchaeota archaeon]